ncbi:MAG TPA: LCP family protein [Actinomycetaceae bacterium]|nr:LCP family protein [Actinomycetaceae bacterium]
MTEPKGTSRPREGEPREREPREGEPREREPRERGPRDRRLLAGVVVVLAVMLVGVAAVVGYYGAAVLGGLNAMERASTVMPAEGASRPAPVAAAEDRAEEPVNVVLMGSDTRGGERGRSDVLQLLHIPGDRSGIFLMSFPRDTWVDIPGRGEAKINAAYSYGGAALTVQTMEQLLDVPMDHVAIIDFGGFIRVIDALGGVTVYNEHASGSDGHTFPEGPVELTGESALVFVRERYNVPGGDLGRAERQRDVIIAVIDKLASTDTLTDPSKFRDAVTSLGPNFTVDEGLDNGRIAELGWKLRSSAGNVRSMQLPITGLGWSDDGQSIVIRDDIALEELRAALRADDLAGFYTSHGA